METQERPNSERGHPLLPQKAPPLKLMKVASKERDILWIRWDPSEKVYKKGTDPKKRRPRKEVQRGSEEQEELNATGEIKVETPSKAPFIASTRCLN